MRQSTHAALLALIDRGLLDKHSAEFVVAPTLLKMTEQLDRLELFTLAIDVSVFENLSPAIKVNLFPLSCK